jgi:hypothetical protein
MSTHLDLSWFEPTLYLLGLIAFLAGRSIYGTRQTGFFFLGVFILVVLNEHVNVFIGRYNYLWQLGRDMNYLSNYTQSIGGNWIWIGVLPGYIFTGWTMGVMASYIIIKTLFPRARALYVSIFTAILVILSGFVAEDLGHINQWWEYTSIGKTLSIFDGVWGGVYVYYLCFITSLILVFEKTIIRKEHFRFLEGIEKALFKKDSEIKIYCFRMGVFSILTCAVTHLFDLIVLKPFAF